MQATALGTKALTIDIQIESNCIALDQSDAVVDVILVKINAASIFARSSVRDFAARCKPAIVATHAENFPETWAMKGATRCWLQSLHVAIVVMITRGQRTHHTSGYIIPGTDPVRWAARNCSGGGSHHLQVRDCRRGGTLGAEL